MTVSTYAKIPTQAFAIARKLTKAQYDVWTYLWEIDAFGDRMRELPPPAKIAKELNLHERTVTRATDRLQDLGLFSFEIQQWRGVNHYGSRSEQAKAKLAQKIQNSPNEDSGCCDTVVQNLTSLSNFGQGDPKNDTDVQKMTQRSNFGQDCQNQGSKLASEADLNLSNNSLITINNSLTNTGNEIQEEIDETFENFSERQEEDFDREEENVESVEATLKIVQESLNQNDLHKEDSKTETNSKNTNSEVDRSSAAAPPRFFKNLREFVIYQAKQDPKINSPEIWANTCLSRNREEWQTKWDVWEQSRVQTTTYTPPKIEISDDPEVRRKAVEDAKKLLPEWMRRNRG